MLLKCAKLGPAQRLVLLESRMVAHLTDTMLGNSLGNPSVNTELHEENGRKRVALDAARPNWGHAVHLVALLVRSCFCNGAVPPKLLPGHNLECAVFSQHPSWKFWTLECTVGEIRVPPTTLYSDAPSSTTWDPNDASGTVNQILDSHSRLRIYSLDDLSERSIGQKPLHIHLVSLPKLKEPAADIFCHCSWEWAMFSDGAVVILLDNVSQQLMLAATNLLGSKTAAKDSHTAPALPATLSNPYPYIVIDSVFYIADKFLRLADSLQLQRFLAFFVKQKSNVFDRLKTAYNAINSSNAGGAGGASDVLGSSLSPINVGDSISQCNDVHRTTPVFEVALVLSIEELHTITSDTIFLDQFCEVIFTDQFYDSMAWVLEVLKKMLLAAEELEKALSEGKDGKTKRAPGKDRPRA